jgi:hypothetical protein
VALLTWLTRKDQPFSWGVEVNNAFQFLKFFYTSALLLIHANPSKPFVLEIDASDFIINVVLSQLGKKNLFHIGLLFS